MQCVKVTGASVSSMQQTPPLCGLAVQEPPTLLFLAKRMLPSCQFDIVNLKIPNVVGDWSELVYTGVKTLDFFQMR